MTDIAKAKADARAWLKWAETQLSQGGLKALLKEVLSALDAQAGEIAALKHDIERHIQIATEQAGEIERLKILTLWSDKREDIERQLHENCAAKDRRIGELARERNDLKAELAEARANHNQDIKTLVEQLGIKEQATQFWKDSDKRIREQLTAAREEIKSGIVALTRLSVRYPDDQTIGNLAGELTRALRRLEDKP